MMNESGRSYRPLGKVVSACSLRLVDRNAAPLAERFETKARHRSKARTVCSIDVPIDNLSIARHVAWCLSLSKG